MSRKRSHDRLLRHRERFVTGAIGHVGADRDVAERVWKMVEGFAGFGFPKSHSAAFGLLAYQSTWLRIHYGPEFLCALLNEQPMGFYAPDSLAHEAQLRGTALRGVDVNRSQVQCTVQDGAVRLGLRYVKGAPEAELSALVQERRRGGPYGSLAELAARREPGGRRSSSSPGRARATAWPRTAPVVRRCGSWGSRPPPRISPTTPPARARPARPSWRCRWSSPRRPPCARWGAGSG